MQNAQAIFLQTIQSLLEDDELEKATDALLDLDERAQAGLRSDIVQQSGRLKQIDRDRRNGFSSNDEYGRYRSQVRFALIELMASVPERLRTNAQLHGLTTYNFAVPDEARLEKIIGPRNNLLKINWLEKALRASKAVCRVVCADGNLGTGFLTREGYLFTNHHVISSPEVARAARIEFNYEMAADGSVRSRTSYALDAADFVASPPEQLDFARVKIVDNPQSPLSQWGGVEFDPSAVPTVGEAVTIVQHPKGQDKQIALNANDVLSVWGRHVFYNTDTEPGSSGAPVFNADWKVVAIHHAGKTEAEGGIQINERGDRAGANRGILFRDIFAFIEAGGRTIQTSAPTSASGKESAQVVENQAQNTPPPLPVPQEKPVVVPSANGLPPKMVILYDVADEAANKALTKHLAVLKFTKKIRLYSLHADTPLGTDPAAQADAEIAEAKVIVGLVTPNFFNDEAWFGRLLAARDMGKTVVPILVEKVDFDGTGLERLKSLPSQNRWLAEFPSPEMAWADVVENLKKAL